MKEFEHGKKCKLLVGVCNASSSGLLCLFDVAASKVVKAVEIPQQVYIIVTVSVGQIIRLDWGSMLVWW